MPQAQIPFSALRAPKGNPRKRFDAAAIEGLAQSIRTDGVLQNLVVVANGEDGFRVHIGKRRYMALKLLHRAGAIGDDYAVPVDIREDVEGEAGLRIATIENVQREALDPIDEAEAFSKLVRAGTSLEDVAAQAGLSQNTVRRRLALAGLTSEVKAKVSRGELSLSLAEALTLASHDQQQAVIAEIEGGAEFDAIDIRRMLLHDRPTMAMAIFPLERYAGSFTADLFGEADTTYFDDVEAFRRLQAEAVGELEEEFKARAAFVDRYDAMYVPWWKYRKRQKGEKGGVVIHLSPSGAVEVRKGLQRDEPEQKSEPQQTVEPQKRERPVFGPTLQRHLAHERSLALFGAILDNPRAMLELAAILMLAPHETPGRIRIDGHPCLSPAMGAGSTSKGLLKLRTTINTLRGKLGLEPQRDAQGQGEAEAEDRGEAAQDGKLEEGGEPERHADRQEDGEADDNAEPDEADLPLLPICDRFTDGAALHEAVRRLCDADLSLLVSLMPILAFGQDRQGADETPTDLFLRIEEGLGVDIRQWWTPDEAYLAMLRRDQLADIAVECGASVGLSRLDQYRKGELVEHLARFFRRTADPQAVLDEYEAKGRKWLPAQMRRPPADPEME